MHIYKTCLSENILFLKEIVVHQKIKVAREKLINTIFDSFFLELESLHCTLTLVLVLSRLKIKFRFSLNPFFQRKQEHAV